MGGDQHIYGKGSHSEGSQNIWNACRIEYGENNRWSTSRRWSLKVVNMGRWQANIEGLVTEIACAIVIYGPRG